MTRSKKGERVWVAVSGAPVAVALSLDSLKDQLESTGYICDSCGQPRGIEITQATLILDPVPVKKRRKA